MEFIQELALKPSDIVELIKFCGKALILFLTALVSSPYLQKAFSDFIEKVNGCIEKWSAKKVSHIELEDTKLGGRIAQLEKINAIRDAKEAEFLKRLDAFDSNSKVLSEKLGTCESKVSEAGINFGSVSFEIKKNLETMNGAVIQRFEKDEGDIQVIDSNVRKILGTVTVLDPNKKP